MGSRKTFAVPHWLKGAVDRVSMAWQTAASARLPPPLRVRGQIANCGCDLGKWQIAEGTKSQIPARRAACFSPTPIDRGKVDDRVAKYRFLRRTGPTKRAMDSGSICQPAGAPQIAKNLSLKSRVQRRRPNLTDYLPRASRTDSSRRVKLKRLLCQRLLCPGVSTGPRGRRGCSRGGSPQSRGSGAAGADFFGLF